MHPLNGKVALVTGASRGIGRAVAERLAADGAAVVVNYATGEADAADVVQGIQARGGTAVAIQADVSRVPDIRRLFRESMERLHRLDILVANAGYCRFQPFAATSEEEFDRTFALNAKGTFFCLQEALLHMADGGRIVCLSTIGTVLNGPGGSCYFGSKAAVEQFSRTLAKEVAPRGINVNVVSPGFTATQMLLGAIDPQAHDELIGMTPLRRLGQPADIADVVAFLASDGARWITRQNLAVDGGIVSR